MRRECQQQPPRPALISRILTSSSRYTGRIPTPDPQARPAVSADIDRQAKTLTNFFNGNVLAVDDIGPATDAESAQ